MASLKLIFSVLLLFGCYCTFANGKRNRARGQRVDQQAPPGLAFSIIKPSSRSGYTADLAGDMCVFECATSTTQNNTGEFLLQMSVPWFETEQFNSNEMTTFCQISGDFKKCVERCDDSNSKTGFLLAHRPIAYMCNNTDYINRLSCFHDAFEANSCAAETCLDQETSVFDKWFTADFSKVENTTSYFDSQCNYYDCYMNCAKPSFVEKCTLDGFNAFKRAAQMKVQAAKETFAAVQQRYVEPVSCTAFRNDDDE